MNLKQEIILLSTLLLISFQCHSFNWKKCEGFIDKDLSVTGSGFFSSTTSFFSSTGECSMIGKIEHDKKVYLAHNFDKMKDEFAKGSGEYATSYAKMHGCNRKGQIMYPLIMKSHLNESNHFNYGEATQEVYEHLEMLFIKNSALKNECRQMEG